MLLYGSSLGIQWTFPPIRTLKPDMCWYLLLVATYAGRSRRQSSALAKKVWWRCWNCETRRQFFLKHGFPSHSFPLYYRISLHLKCWCMEGMRNPIVPSQKIRFVLRATMPRAARHLCLISSSKNKNRVWKEVVTFVMSWWFAKVVFLALSS